MSVRKLTARICGSLVLLCGLATANAQEHVPVADPFEFDPDFRWFEPIYQADLMDMKPSKRANYGWFATYDRLNLYGSRPELFGPNGIQRGETRLDSGWGNRYELGFMLPEEDNGWLFSWIDTTVNKYDKTRRERLNRLNEDDLEGDATNPAPPFGFEAIERDGNNLGYNYRFVDFGRSENHVEFDSYELSKTWRLEPYHYGGILEPLAGIRWFRIEDTNVFQSFISTGDDPEAEVPPLTDIFGAAAERLTTNQSFTENEAITGQLGFRYFKHHNRFIFSTDFRVFAGGNWQSSTFNQVIETVVYDSDDPGIGDEVDYIIDEQTDRLYSNNDEFFLGFDVRGEVAYQFTRDITARCGFQLIDIERGLWRGGDPSIAFGNGGPSDQDLLLVGATFGITLNR
jgi:hypothetical protein